MTHSELYIKYWQSLFDKGIAIEFTNCRLDDDTTWVEVSEHNYQPKNEGPRASGNYHARYRLASHPKDCPPVHTPEYRDYWVEAVNAGKYIHIVPSRNKPHAPTHSVSYYNSHIVFEYGPGASPDIKTSDGTIVDIKTSAPDPELITGTDCLAPPDLNNFDHFMARRGASASNHSPLLMKEETMPQDKITIEIPAHCVEQVKPKKAKTELQARPSLAARYYDHDGVLKQERSYSGKNAMKKAKAVLREPHAVGWTMVPYHIGKAVRVKVELETVK